MALLHQLPAKPPYLRVKIWRRLQAIGAVPLKNAVHVLPASETSEAALREVMDEIVDGGGEATLIRAALIAGQSDREVRALFDAARDADYAEISDTARRLLASGPASGGEIARLYRRLEDTGRIDFFGASGRQIAEAALTELVRLRHVHPDVARNEPGPLLTREALTGRVWVTRAGVHVDRIASAWLIRRFVDPRARFRFVDARTHEPVAGELRFDMADGEFTHEDDRCSFETIVLRAGLSDDAALTAIGEIIHELDIGDGKFARPEAPGVAAMLAGVCASSEDDLERIERAGGALDQFYSFFASRKQGG
ncbi:ChrB protein [Sphingomonas turrisvirgatae]|uniref:ChrB protein n=1 Tax=Sphingomonas turrisvirgatae TaxID=1888892 RepID=A0A1E3LRL1_9SPHN|nr:ChrB protein [Sphingomonas turrisvirgatae]